jgi:hypothetical protein
MNESTSALRPHPALVLPSIHPHLGTLSRTKQVEQPAAERTYQFNAVANSRYIKRVNRLTDGMTRIIFHWSRYCIYLQREQIRIYEKETTLHGEELQNLYF